MATIKVAHGGNVGDIIYSLSVLKNLGQSIEYYIKLNQPSTFTSKTHPVGNVMVNQKMYDMVKPLLESQSYIQKVDLYTHDIEIDYDLDLFRTECKNLSAGDIKLWYCNAHPELTANTSEQCLVVEPIINDYVIFNRTSRYNNPLIDYTILPENTIFVGVTDEYKIIQAIRPDIKHLEVKDFYELAQYIAGCQLFIGNQSTPFAIAEQLKVKRILEQYHGCPNVIPQGGEWSIFHTQKQFEKIWQKHLKQDKED